MWLDHPIVAQVHNISLRMLHLTKQTRIQRVFVARLQRLLRETRVGETFFRAVAQPKVGFLDPHPACLPGPSMRMRGYAWYMYECTPAKSGGMLHRL